MVMSHFFTRWKRALPGAMAAFAGLALAAGMVRADATYPHTYLVSAGPPGVDPQPLLTHANYTSEYAQSSYDGQRAVFSADATNLDPAVKAVADGGDSDGTSWDIFLRVLDPSNPSQGSTYLVSSTRTSAGVFYDGVNPTLIAAGVDGSQSSWATISRDGKWIVYQSTANGIITPDDSSFTDIFLVNADEIISRSIVPDRKVVSARSASVKANGPSGNPTYNAGARTFSDPYPPAVTYIRPTQPTPLPCAVYQSEASNLDPAFSDANGRSDLFVWCKQTKEGALDPNTNRLLTRTASGAAMNGAGWHPTVSYDGRFVAFVSDATNLVAGISGTQVYLMDRDPEGDGDLNNSNPSYALVSRTISGAGGNGRSWYPSISANGNFVAFASSASDLETQKTDFDLVTPIIDTNGKSDIYLYNHRTRRTELVSLRMTQSGTGFNPATQPRYLQDNSYAPSISADGRFVAFKATVNFVVPSYDILQDFSDPDHVTPTPDIFLYDRLASIPVLQVVKISLGDDNSSETTLSQTAFPAVSGNKRFVFFTSDDPCYPLGNGVEGACRPPTYWRNIYARDLGPPQSGEGALGVAPGGASFYPVMPGTAGSKTVTFTLKNWGSASLDITSVSITPADVAKGFSLSANNCTAGTTLDPAAEGLATSDACTFQVIYHPPADGNYGRRTASVTVDWRYLDAVSGLVSRSDVIALEGGPLQVFIPAVRK